MVLYPYPRFEYNCEPCSTIVLLALGWFEHLSNLVIVIELGAPPRNDTFSSSLTSSWCPVDDGSHAASIWDLSVAPVEVPDTLPAAQSVDDEENADFGRKMQSNAQAEFGEVST